MGLELIHASAKPLKNRKHPGNTIFVSMTPAIWASQEDIKKHQEAIACAKMTTHWSSAGIKPWTCRAGDGINYPKKVPDVPKSEEA